MTSRALATGLVTVALVATGGLAATLPASAAPLAPFDALTVRFPATGAGTGALTLEKPAVTLSAVLTDAGVLTATATATGGATSASVTVTPPVGGSLAAGQTVQLAATPSATHGSVTLGLPGGDCTYTSGSVVVPELVGDTAAVTVLAADVVGTCGTVQARVGATTAWSGLTVPAAVDLGAADLLAYAEQDVVVRVTGTSAVTFGSSRVATPAGADDFPEFDVIDDGCEGRTVVPDSTCTVTVGFSPWTAGERTGILTVPDTTSTGSTRVRLTGTGTTNSKGTYVGVPAPTRLLDTRTAGTRTPLRGGSTTRLQVAGAGGVPASGVSAVVLNLTAVGTTSQGYFTLHPNGVPRPTASSINFPRGWTGANMVTVPVGADGKVALYNYGGATHAVVDVLGWYWKDTEKPIGSQFMPFGDAFRIYDSRQGDGALGGGDHVDLAGVVGGPGETSDVAQFVVNITAVGATKPGVLTAWSGVGTRPRASTVNYEPKVIAPNMAVVTAGHTGSGAGFRVSNTTSGSVHVVIDVVGIQLAESPFGLRFTPRATPTRILDTRKPTGLSGPFGPGQTRTVNASSVSTPDSFGIVANTTGITPTRQTYLSTWSGEVGSQRPDASLLNVNPGLVRSASTYALMSDTLRFKLYNNAGSMHVAMDVAGTLDFYPGSDAVGPMVTAERPVGADAGALPTLRGRAGRELRPTVTMEDGTATVTRH